MQIMSFERSIEQLEAQLIAAAKQCNASDYNLLELAAEFEVRQAYRLFLLNSTAEWLSMYCGVALPTAREKVRAALVLLERPLWSAAFRDGKLSWSQVRAMTRVPDPDEAGLLEVALSRTVSQVESHCQQLRNARHAESRRDANRMHRNRWLTCHEDADGNFHLNVDLPPEKGRLVAKALEIATEALGEVDIDEEDAFFKKQADAMVEMATAYLTGRRDGKGRTGDHYQVIVRVDDAALKREGGKSDLPVETVERLMCDSDIVEVTMDDNGDPLDVGRKYRTLTPQQQRALEARDPHCQYPGCSHTRFLENHHVITWADGGRTSLPNTMRMCSRHHRLFHEGGYTLGKDHRGNWYVRTQHGKFLTERLYAECDTDAPRDAFGDSHLAGASHAAFGCDHAGNPPRGAPGNEQVAAGATTDELGRDGAEDPPRGAFGYRADPTRHAQERRYLQDISGTSRDERVKEPAAAYLARPVTGPRASPAIC